DVAPHPHTGLQTVSWLFSGAIEHIDSGGITGLVLPGEVNLMTAGRGICHSEVSTEDTTSLHGVQLWLALPEATRRQDEREFAHYAPQVTPCDGGEMLVFLGHLWDTSSPVRTHTPLLGAEIRLDGGATVDLPVDTAFEHGLLVDSGEIELEKVALPAGALGYTGVGSSELRISNCGSNAARLVLPGCDRFPDYMVMGRNSDARTHEQIVTSREQWQAESEWSGAADGYIGRGGPGRNADGHGRLHAPRLPEVTIKARRKPPPRVKGGPDG